MTLEENFSYPNLTGKDTETQIKQLVQYIYQLVDQITFQFDQVPNYHEVDESKLVKMSELSQLITDTAIMNKVKIKEINIGNGVFTVDENGKVVAKNLNMEGGSINLNTSSNTNDIVKFTYQDVNNNETTVSFSTSMFQQTNKNATSEAWARITFGSSLGLDYKLKNGTGHNRISLSATLGKIQVSKYNSSDTITDEVSITPTGITVNKSGTDYSLRPIAVYGVESSNVGITNQSASGAFYSGSLKNLNDIVSGLTADRIIGITILDWGGAHGSFNLYIDDKASTPCIRAMSDISQTVSSLRFRVAYLV